MGLFGSSDTVDQKATAALEDFGPDPTRYEVGTAVGEIAARLNVDPDTVEQKLRENDDEDVLPPADAVAPDTASGRDALVADVAAALDLSPDNVRELLDAVADSDASVADIVATLDDVDQQADTEPETDMGDGTNPPDDDPSIDQKQDDGGDGTDVSYLNLIDESEQFDQSAEDVENAADITGQGADGLAKQMVLGEDAMADDDGGADGGDTDTAGGDTPAADQAGGNAPTVDQAGGQPAADQKASAVTQEQITGMVADAVTGDEVLDQLADAVAQKMVANDEFADNLVDTVEQKGDFATTDEVTTTAAPADTAQTVDDAAPLTGGDGE
jgi:hypothetical protein